MASLPALAPPALALPALPATSITGPLCPHCGGSGTLRLDDQKFRTCLDCLGQGQLPASVQQELLFPCFSAAVSSAHAG